MTYFLKTSLTCNNNCLYCRLLDKKSKKEKSLKDVEKEIEKAKNSGYESIKLSCNTDIRKDFLEILELIKGNGLRIILETNGRIFCYRSFLEKVDKYIDRYEPYLNFSSPGISQGITGVKDVYDQTIKGIENISGFCSNKDIVAKIVLIKDISLLPNIINRLSQIRIKKIKLVYPFKLSQSDPILSMVEVVPKIVLAKKIAQDEGIEILINKDLEHNPYLPKDLSFFDTNRARLEIDYQRHEDRPKFSIVIPAHNRKNNLKLVLESFFKQDYPKSKYEVIVIDDGSQDNTLAMVKKMKPTCNLKYFYWPRTKIPLEKSIKKWNKFYNRVGFSRNIGIDNSQGEIILFNDSDILVEKDCLKKHEKHHQKYRNIIVRGFRMFLPKGSVNLDRSWPEKTERTTRLHCRMYDLSKEGWQRIVTSNLSIRKKYLEKVSGFSQDFIFWGFEDVDLGYRLSKKLKIRFIWDDGIKVYHLYHPVESTLDSSAALWLGANMLYRKYLDESIYYVYGEVILHRLDDLIL